jgi:hypothetical protein
MYTAAMNASPTAYTVAGVSHQKPKGRDRLQPSDHDSRENGTARGAQATTGVRILVLVG